MPKLKNYIVPVFYRGMGNFAVEARDSEHAKEIAELHFRDGRQEVMCGNEFEEVERVGDPEETTDR